MYKQRVQAAPKPYHRRAARHNLHDPVRRPMFSPYLFFKVLHVAAAIVWIGGVMTLTILNARLERTQDEAAVRFLAGQGAFFGRSVVGPAAGVTLLAGVALVVLGGGNMALWTVWGM